MANWTGVITNAGNDVLSEWVNEKTLNFDSAAAGQGTVAAAGMLAQTALVNQKQIASIIGADRVSTGIRLKIRITAPQTAYTLNQYGVWASITGGSSTMVALFQHEQGIPIPSATESPDFVYTFYALITTSNTGKWTVNIDTSAAVTLEEMNSAIATAVATKEGLIKDAAVKNSIADADSIAVVDSADSKTKRVLWSTIKSALGQVFAPLTRKINNKPLSSDVVLTGDDIATSATDGTTVSSSLSNLAGEKYTKMLGDIPQTWDEIWALEPGVYSWVQSMPFEWQPDDTPSGALRVELSVHTSAPDVPGGTRSAMLSYIDGVATRARYIGERTSSGDYWAKLATATPPQEFNLPLVDGISGTAKYSKDQFGIVRVYVAVLKNSGTITNNEILGTLPEGFRSKHNFAVVCFGNSNQNNIVDRHPINMIISSNGNITASFLSETDGTKIASLYGTAEFLPES